MPKVKVLVVEDNELLRTMLIRRLARHGFEMSEAADGDGALKQVQLSRPDVIIMDMSLPDVDGWEATSRLKRDPLTQAIPVIALTAHALAQDRQRGLDAGCDAYETKPIDLQRLITKITNLIPS